MVIHPRIRFAEDDDPVRHRKILRLWLKMSIARCLAPDFPGWDGFD